METYDRVDSASPRFTQQYLTHGYHNQSPTKTHHDIIDEITAAANVETSHRPQTSPTKGSMPPIIMEEGEEELKQLSVTNGTESVPTESVVTNGDSHSNKLNGSAHAIQPEATSSNQDQNENE